MSLVVVINGPVARAGSIFKRSRTNGNNVPKIAAITTTTKMETPMVIPIIISALAI